MIIKLENEDREAFAGVLPKNVNLKGFRVALGAAGSDGTVYGAVSYVLIDHEYDIDWIYVEPAYRRKGIGTALMKQALTAIEKSGDRFLASARFEYTEEDSAMHTFFLSLGSWMDVSYSHERYYLDPENIESSHLAARKRNTQDKPVPFFMLPTVLQKKILYRLFEKGVYVINNPDRWREEICGELSRVVMKGNEPVCIIFVRKDVNGNLSLDYLYSRDMQGMLELISYTAADALRLYPDSVLYYDCLEESTSKISGRLFPKAEKTYIYEAVF
ncbi:MAG: GNAT family N-acetyltransferase [Lachnospiraceae bacterium]|nr:GNAT family N-acetyltransferase [Lachnospiraceae bacterium]